ncbi:hypothetical protein EB796_013125 [Bugula neritina]|uniref:Uncharacterized protein n=1 Tax=Bugula neritina TaxID=10212 RepID=A0A7J7JSY8_BUGNE|nr:hypothetical protein EB796_013125 [Bugula neritina]
MSYSYSRDRSFDSRGRSDRKFNGSSGGGGSYGSYGSRGGSGYGGSRGGYDRGDRYGGDRHGGRGKSDGAGMSLKAPRWDLARLSKIEKDFYTPSPATQNRPDFEIQSYYSQRDNHSGEKYTEANANISRKPCFLIMSTTP